MKGTCVMNKLKNILRKYPGLMSVNDIQDVLHIGRSKAYSLLKNGKIKSIRIGTKYRIPKAYLIDFLNENACFSGDNLV